MLFSPVLLSFRSICFYYSIGDVLDDILISAKKKNYCDTSKLSVKVTGLFKGPFKSLEGAVSWWRYPGLRR